MMRQRVQSCVLGGTSGEGVQWTVDDLDGGGGLMANKKKVLRLRAIKVFVGTIPSLGHSWGERGKFIGSKTKYNLKGFSRKSSGI